MKSIVVVHLEDASFDRINHPRRSCSFQNMTVKALSSVILFVRAALSIPCTRSFLHYNLRRTLRRKRPAFLNNAIILQDEANSHTAACVQKLFQRQGWEILQQPPYSPDHSPCDFDPIPKLKAPLRWERFANWVYILNRKIISRSRVLVNPIAATTNERKQ